MVVVYGMSAVQMAHNEWFSMKPAVVESEVEAGAFAGTDGRALAQSLMDRYGMRGDLQQVKATDEGIQMRIARPGTVYEVEYTRQTGRARIKTSVAGFIGMLNRLHHLAGLKHDYRLLNVWGGIVVFVSVALILLGLSGIYLWFKIYEERAVGAILLAFSLGYSLTLIVMIRMA